MSADEIDDPGASPPVLQAYRGKAGPPAGKKDQNWAALRAAVGAPLLDAQPTAPTPPKGGSWAGPLIGLACVGLAIGGMLWGAQAAEEPPRPPATENVTTGPARKASTLARGSDVPPRSPPTSPPEVAPLTTLDGPLPSEPSSARRPRSPAVEPPAPSAPPTEAPASGLAEEIALLSEARRAVARGDAQEALDALDRHAARFPEGTLAREREVTRILALCLAHRTSDAARVAAALAPNPTAERALSRCEEP